jgi:predicted esterase
MKKMLILAIVILSTLLAGGCQHTATSVIERPHTEPVITSRQALIQRYQVTLQDAQRRTTDDGEYRWEVHGTWESDVITGEDSGEPRGAISVERLASIDLVSFESPGEGEDEESRAFMERRIAATEPLTARLLTIDSLGADGTGRGVWHGAYYRTLLGGFDITVLPGTNVAPGDTWSRTVDYGTVRYQYHYHAADYETRETVPCILIEGTATLGPQHEGLEYPKSDSFAMKLWYSPVKKLVCALEVSGHVQWTPRDQITRHVTMTYMGSPDLRNELGQLPAERILDVFEGVSTNRWLMVMQSLALTTQHELPGDWPDVIELLRYQAEEERSPLYPEQDLLAVEQEINQDPDLFDRLMVYGASPEIRALAAYYLGLRGSTHARITLERALSDSSARVRRAAAGAILRRVEHGDEFEVEALRTMLRDPDGTVRVRGVLAAQRMSAEKEIRKKLEELSHSDPLPKVRRNAALAAGLSEREGERAEEDDLVEVTDILLKPHEFIDLPCDSLKHLVTERLRYPDRSGGVVFEETIVPMLLGTIAHYALAIPEDYDPSRKWPVILALAGGSGNGEAYMKEWLDLIGDRDFLVACPLAEGMRWWQDGSDLVVGVLNHLKTSFNVDENRVYVVGESNGGLGAYFLATRYSDLFAAAATINGNPVNEKTEDDNPLFVRNLLNVPLRVTHGSEDPVIPVEADRELSARLDSLGYWVEYLETEGLGHEMRRDEAGRSLDHLEALDFFSQVVREPAPQHVICVCDVAERGRRFWLEISPDSGMAMAEAQVVSQNYIDVECTGVSDITIYLSEEMFDLAEPITVTANGEMRFWGTVERDPEVMLTDYINRGDRTQLYEARIDVKGDIP